MSYWFEENRIAAVVVVGIVALVALGGWASIKARRECVSACLADGRSDFECRYVVCERRTTVDVVPVPVIVR